MEKVKLTKEQASLVEEIITERTVWTHLMDLSREELGLALSGHYELVAEAPKFFEGDLVVRKDGHPFTGNMRIGTISRKTSKADELVLPRNEEIPRWFHRGRLRHATPEEIYWLETLGRKKVNDFQKGDAVLDADGSLTRITTQYHIDQAISWYRDRSEELIGIYPDEAFRIFPEETVK